MSKFTSTNPLLVLILVAFCTSASKLELQRITNGEICHIKRFPFAVQYYQQMEKSERRACGGALITYQWVLSAAHCYFNHKTVIKTVVVAGTSHRHFRVQDSEGIVRKVIGHVPHPDYRKGSKRILTNDIVLAKLESPFPKNHAWIKPGKLPPSNFTSSARKAVLMGWGSQKPIPLDENLITKYPDYFHNHPVKGVPADSNVLMCTTVVLAQQHECQRNYPEDFKIWPSHICSRPYDGQSPCSGDTGGPLAVNDTIVGISMKGYGCGQNVYSVYTRVDKYIDFIEKHITDVGAVKKRKQKSSDKAKSKNVLDMKPSPVLIYLSVIWVILVLKCPTHIIKCQ